MNYKASKHFYIHTLYMLLKINPQSMLPETVG